MMSDYYTHVSSSCHFGGPTNVHPSSCEPPRRTIVYCFNLTSIQRAVLLCRHIFCVVEGSRVYLAVVLFFFFLLRSKFKIHFQNGAAMGVLEYSSLKQTERRERTRKTIRCRVFMYNMYHVYKCTYIFGGYDDTTTCGTCAVHVATERPCGDSRTAVPRKQLLWSYGKHLSVCPTSVCLLRARESKYRRNYTAVEAAKYLRPSSVVCHDIPPMNSFPSTSLSLSWATEPAAPGA